MLTPTANKSPNHARGYCQLQRFDEGPAPTPISLNVWGNTAKSFASSSHFLTVNELAGLRIDENEPTLLHIHERPKRKLNKTPEQMRLTDVTESYSRMPLKGKLMCRTGELRNLSPANISVLLAVRIENSDGTVHVKATLSHKLGRRTETTSRVYLVTCSHVTSLTEESRTQPSRVADFRLWTTGMQAPPGWWLELKARCSRICEDS